MPVRNPRHSGHLTRLDTRLETFAGTSLFNPGSEAAPGITYVLDEYADAGGTACNAAYCVSHRVSSLYSGPLYRVVRTSDSAPLDVEFVEETGLADTAALATHCAGTTGYIDLIYDQSGNARNVTQATATLRPNAFHNGLGGVRMIGDLHVAVLSPSAGSGSIMERADAFGLTGSPAMSVVHFGRHPTDALKQIVAVGSTAGGDDFTLGFEITTGNTVISGNGFAALVRREFTTVPAVTEFNYYVTAHAAGANFSAITARANGADLVEAEVSAGAMNISATRGRVFGAGTTTGAEASATFILSEVLSGAKQAVFETFGATCRALAGY